MTEPPESQSAEPSLPDQEAGPEAPEDPTRPSGWEGLVDWIRSLRRSNTQRILGGVAGGLAETSGVPVWLVRVGFVLLALPLFGVLLYLLMWVSIPIRGRQQPALSAPTVVVAVVVFLFAMPLVSGITFRSAQLVPLLLVVIGLALLMRRDGAGPFAGSTRDGPPDVDYSGEPPMNHEPLNSKDEPVTAGSEINGSEISSQRVPKERRQAVFPLVGLVTWSIVFLAMGVVGLLTLSDTILVGPGVMAALALVLFSAGLIFSAFRGRARGLILPVLGLTVTLGMLGALDMRVTSIDAPINERFTEQSSMPPELKATAGTSTIDLSALRLGSDDYLLVDQSVGRLVVVLPTDLTVRVMAKVGAGTISVDKPSQMMFAGMFPETGLRWAEDGVPRAGDPLDRELIEMGLDSGSLSAGTRTLGSGIGKVTDKTFDRESEHVLTLELSMGLGTIELIDPHWADETVNLTKPEQLCTIGGAPQGTVKPCGEVEEGSRVALCINANFYLVDCREDRPGTQDNPRIAACRGLFGDHVDCEEVGIAPIGAQLVSPPDPNGPDLEDPDRADIEPNAPESQATVPTIAVPDGVDGSPRSGNPQADNPQADNPQGGS